MSEKPIIFSTDMVKAILEGRKTQTRRVMNPQPPDDYFEKINRNETQMFHRNWLVPKYQVGDILWLKEAWRIGAWDCEGGVCIDYKAGGYSGWIDIYPNDDGEKYQKLWIQCTDDADKAGIRLGNDEKYHWEKGQSPCRWRTSRFMPKTLARIWLEVTGVRVERIQDISEKDAWSEGCPNPSPIDSREWFEQLWDKLNLKRGYSFESNPFVWVYEFKRIKL